MGVPCFRILYAAMAWLGIRITNVKWSRNGCSIFRIIYAAMACWGVRITKVKWFQIGICSDGCCSRPWGWSLVFVLTIWTSWASMWCGASVGMVPGLVRYGGHPSASQPRTSSRMGRLPETIFPVLRRCWTVMSHWSVFRIDTGFVGSGLYGNPRCRNSWGDQSAAERLAGTGPKSLFGRRSVSAGW